VPADHAHCRWACRGHVCQTVLACWRSPAAAMGACHPTCACAAPAPCRTVYVIRSHEGPLPAEGFAGMLDCGLLTQAPSLHSLEQVMPGWHEASQRSTAM
jgi:hypothetical protein